LKTDANGDLQIISLGKDKKEGGEGKNRDFNILKEEEYPEEFLQKK
ncbi:MAG TPA: type II secretion system protein GspG, partial [Leptospiraceae bacterium]|nr:type II secretion system protein GspG [Leptospiraceae bacterium]